MEGPVHRGRFDEYAKRLAAIDWFAKIGTPAAKYEVVADNWTAARERLTSDEFGDQKMDAQNALSRYLSRGHTEEYQVWNDVVDLAWAKLADEKDKLVAAIDAESERDPVWKRCRACLTLAFSEAWYSDLAPPELNFGRSMFAVFEAGRLPCGYAGGFPTGRFRVY